MLKKVFIVSVILGIILTPYCFNFSKPNNLHDLTSGAAAHAAGADAINDLESGHICASSALTRPKTDLLGHLITQTLTADKSPYYFTGAVSLAKNNILTIEPGVVIKVSDEYFYEWYMYPVTFSIAGKVIAQGTETNPIVFTSIYDDSYCGDSNGDGAATAPKPGSWGGWKISSGDNVFDHVIMKYGGDYKRGLMVFYANTGNQITNSVFEDNLRGIDFQVGSSSNPAIIENNVFFNNAGGVMAFHQSANPIIRYNDIYNNKGGIVVSDSATPLINYNNIYNNSGYGASVNQYYSLTQPVNAQFNWWGDNSGPYHPVLNPQGKGNKVSDKILFDPWIGKEEKKDPVIIVPGIMGSWEKHGEWVIDPILHTYDNLIEAMAKSGYELNKTLFLFPYDWRVNNVITAGLLKDKIAEVKQKTNNGKVDIVAHSMGGFVSRYYIQSNEYNDDVDQLIFLGTPHQGSPRSYLTYEGGYIPGRLGSIMKYDFQIEAIKRGYISLPQYIKEQIPSVEQLLPVYDYLQEKVNNEWQFRLYPVQYPGNTFLENLNTEPAMDVLRQRVDIANIYSSAGANSTLSAIKVIPDLDIYDSKWMDGYPENLEEGNLSCLIFGGGDGTVPSKSLNFLQGVDTVEIADAGHREIVTQAQKEVIEILLSKRPADFYQNSWPIVKRILFIRVYSPVDFAVIAPDGKTIGKDFSANMEINQIEGAFYSGFDTDAEFATILNPQEGDYQVKLQGTGNGIYQLGVDILEENNLAEQAENIITGIISAGKEENFSFNCQKDAVAVDIVKEINFNDLIQDLDELYGEGEIEKEFVKKILDIKFRHLSEKYDKIEGRKKASHEQILKKQIVHSLEIIKKELKFYLAKDWITQTAYEVLVNDIINIINKLN